MKMHLVVFMTRKSGGYCTMTSGGSTNSVDPGTYWRKHKQRLKAEGSEVVTNCHGLQLVAADGKRYLTDCANTEGIFRLIQSIPSPKAEPSNAGWSKSTENG